MGGWQSLLLARERAARLVGLVTIAAAPDFTEDGYWASFSEAERATLERDGFLRIPSEYDEDYIITKRMIEDGRDRFVLRSPLVLDFPVRFLQGTEDTAVPTSHADHRFSNDTCLRLIETALADVLERI